MACLTSKSDPAFQVRSLLFQSKMQEIAVQRKDEWGHTIHERLNMVIDLPAADACYHQSCGFSYFETDPKQIQFKLKEETCWPSCE